MQYQFLFSSLPLERKKKQLLTAVSPNESMTAIRIKIGAVEQMKLVSQQCLQFDHKGEIIMNPVLHLVL